MPSPSPRSIRPARAILQSSSTNRGPRSRTSSFIRHPIDRRSGVASHALARIVVARASSIASAPSSPSPRPRVVVEREREVVDRDIHPKRHIETS